MIGLVLVTHGRLAESSASAVEHVVGPQEHSRPSPSAPRTTWSSAGSDIVDAVRRADSGTGVMVLTDMFGGTPPTSRSR